MQQPLVVEVQDKKTCGEAFCFEFVLVLKVFSLVALTYGLMILMFQICLQIQMCQGTYAQSYEAGGGIILALFIAMWIFWGGLWCWGAGKREQLRRDIVETQLALIRAQEKAEEQKDLEEERRMIQQKRNQAGR